MCEMNLKARLHEQLGDWMEGGTSPIRNSPLPREHHRTLGIVLL